MNKAAGIPLPDIPYGKTEPGGVQQKEIVEVPLTRRAAAMLAAISNSSLPTITSGRMACCSAVAIRSSCSRLRDLPAPSGLASASATRVVT